MFALQSIFDTNQLGSAGCTDSSCALPYAHYLNTSLTAFATTSGRATGAFVDMCSRHCNTARVGMIDGRTSLGAFAEWFAGLGAHRDGDGDGDGDGRAGGPTRRLWMQQTAAPFNRKAPYCADCC